MLPLLWFTPWKAMHIIEYERATAINGVPTMFIGMLEHRDFENYDFSSLRTGIMAGSPCPSEIMKRVINDMNMREVVIVFGQTEAAPGCTMTTVDDSVERRVETVGKTFPFMETKLIDPETGKDVGIGVPGEFCVRGYNVMKGYYKHSEATAGAIDKDGWLHTGDLATVDADGYYKITGRIKDMIIRGGENLYPKEIEDFIYTHPKVRDVQIVAVPSEKYGEEAFAFVILKDKENATPQDIQKYVFDHMARYKVPSFVEFTDTFPMTASGKIQKFKLRDKAIEILGL